MAISGGGVVEVKRAFIGAGCNRQSTMSLTASLIWLPSARKNALAIFCPKTAQILTTLPGHKASVNCTHWLPSAKFASKVKLEMLMVSIILWELSVLEGKWRHVLKVPESHKKGVTCISAIMVSETEAIFASTSSDGTIYLWEVAFPFIGGGECKLSCLDSLLVGSKPMVALSLAELPGINGRIVLAMGGLDSKIHLYCGERTGKFVYACELKGHTDWIQCLDFSLPIHTDSKTQTILLVSSSQDRGI